MPTERADPEDGCHGGVGDGLVLPVPSHVPEVTDLGAPFCDDCYHARAASWTELAPTSRLVLENEHVFDEGLRRVVLIVRGEGSCPRGADEGACL